MITAVARSADDPRTMRGPAGRRALQLVLFVGGLLALGLLFGTRAHADQHPLPQLPGTTSGAGAGVGAGAAVDEAAPVVDEAAPVVDEAASGADKSAARVDKPTSGLNEAGSSVRKSASTVHRSPSTAHKSAPSVAGSVAVPAPVPATSSAHDAHKRPAAPVSRIAQHTAAGSVPTPAAAHRSVAEPVRRDTVRPDAGKGLGTAVTDLLDTAGNSGNSGSSTRLHPGELPLRELPLRELPLRELPLPDLLSSVLPFPGQLSPTDPEAPAAGARPAPGSADDGVRHPAAPRPVTVPMALTASGPGGSPVARESACADHRAVVADHRPGHRGPFGPGGDRGGSASAEFHPPRGGDQPAVSFRDGISFGLVRGAGLPATAAPVSDRSGDILEFPG
ncbi:hypothetical protein [Streptomyces sp. NPDC058382]|uniref:hypothetical protein n=1 Tax=unclassified Streptomyces TaxID=2593676 RepID=UPI00363B9F99